LPKYNCDENLTVVIAKSIQSGSNLGESSPTSHRLSPDATNKGYQFDWQNQAHNCRNLLMQQKVTFDNSKLTIVTAM
jgi:hypothetical protein